MLPKLNHPTFKTIIPSTGKEIRYRPLLVKEQKMILKAVEFDDTENLIETVYNVVRDCTFNEVEVEKLPVFDVEWLYLRIRDVSSGSIIPTRYKCRNKIEDNKECGTVITVNLNTEHAKVNIPKDVETTIMIDEKNKVGIKLRYPTFRNFIENAKNHANSVTDLIEAFILDCVEMVFEGDKVYLTDKDFTREELREFIDQLTGHVISKIEKFIEKIPQLEMDVHIRCPKCGHQETIKLRGINDFFA